MCCTPSQNATRALSLSNWRAISGIRSQSAPGWDYARGDGVIVMDSDLQDPPEVLPEFIARWREGIRCRLCSARKPEGESAAAGGVCAVLPPVAMDCQY
jgi:glycosyltransferase involved in cell wall biosynthesis